MKPIVCVSSEGQDTKIVILSKEKGKVKVKKTFSMTMTGFDTFDDAQTNEFSEESFAGLDAEMSFEGIEETNNELKAVDKSDVTYASQYFTKDELKNAEFIPVVTDPIVNHHNYSGKIEKSKKKNIQAILDDLAKTKNISVPADSIDYLTINDKTLHSVFIREDNTSVDFINSLAEQNNRRFYKIATIKNSETALARYISKTNKFFEEDYTLIINTGSESSKLIFLKGNNLAHIGSSLDIGTKDIHTYDVYFSKILLEMENGNIPKLDNVFLCGEDNSENLVLSFYGTFPEANVNELQFEDLDLTELSDEQRDNISSFAFAITAGLEYFEEKESKYKGINFLPKYIQDNQKIIHFGWHSIVVLPILFAAAYFFTVQILDNRQHIIEQRSEISRLEILKAQNEQIVAQMENYSAKISNFDNTQAILDSATAGAAVWGKMLSNISDFMERRRNFWVSTLGTNKNNMVSLKGHTLSRNVLTEFVDINNSSSLNTITYEPLRETKAYSYTMNFNINTDGANKK
ncbi:MAG: hypothetical protein CR986_02555 [Ignavibacteriae bacterium]|nr:MAG: hypothetical protein CR986_02555 [Ignavibacteriota bacterium]